jgi:hypothetical protein
MAHSQGKGGVHEATAGYTSRDSCAMPEKQCSRNQLVPGVYDGGSGAIISVGLDGGSGSTIPVGP